MGDEADAAVEWYSRSWEPPPVPRRRNQAPLRPLPKHPTEEDMMTAPRECSSCGTAIADIGGMTVEVERTGFDMFESIDVEHTC